MHCVCAIWVFGGLHLSFLEIVICEEFGLLFFLLLLVFFVAFEQIGVRNFLRLHKLAVLRLSNINITRVLLVAQSRRRFGIFEIRRGNLGSLSCFLLFFTLFRLWLIFLFLGRHQPVNDLLERPFSDVLVTHLGLELSDIGHFKLLNFEIRLARILTALLSRRSLGFGRRFASLCFLSDPLCLLSCLLSLVLRKCLSLQLSLFLLGFKAELFLDFFTARLFVNLEASAHIGFIIIIELVHGVGMRVEDFDVVHVVVAIASLDLVEEVKAVLELLVKLHVVDSLLHLSHFSSQLILLVAHNLIKSVACLSKGNLEVDLCQLELLLVVVHSGAKVLIEVDNIGANLAHLVHGIVHEVDGIGVERL